jgi:hypothetical protein
MSSVYRGNVCPDCGGEGRITDCTQCGGNGTIICDLCGGDGVRMAPSLEGERSSTCVCKSGYFTCAACSGGTGVCGRCIGTGFLQS